MEGGSTTMSTAYSSTDVVSTPLVLLDRELKKVTIGLAIRGKILVGRACARTSTFTWLKINWKPSLCEYPLCPKILVIKMDTNGCIYN